MATCLNKAVVRGEIDNTERGRVRGRVWLAGRDEPVELDLEGNAWRDVAGARVTFINPRPRPQRCATTLAAIQRGLVGDITTERQVPCENAEGGRPRRAARGKDSGPWQCALSIEWFSKSDGRVLIESADFEVEITAFAWELDEADEQAQQLMNQHAMRDWLATIIQRPEPHEEQDGEDAFTEAAWEESMKQSDRLNTAHMEALDKYGFDDDDESRVAFVMGWDHLLDALANDSDQDTRRITADGPADDEDDDLDDEPEDAGEEWKTGGRPFLDFDDDEEEDGEASSADAGAVDDDADFDAWMARRERHRHPLVKMGSDLVLRLMRDLKEEDEDERSHEEDDVEDDDEAQTPLDRFISNTMSISGKLAGALGDPEFAEGIHAGHTLAVLKRCLNWSNEALAGLNDLLADSRWEARHMIFSEYKRELHTIRDAITDLRREIRDANPGV
jgi:hypothetical protein